MTISHRTSALLFCLVATAAACDDDGGGVSTPCESTVSREAVLATVAEDATASLERVTGQHDRLVESLTTFAEAPTATGLEEARDRLSNARGTFPEIDAFSLVLDPAQTFLPAIDAFPVDTSSVGDYVTRGTYDLGSAPNFDRGYAAIEFLLYGIEPDGRFDYLAASPEARQLALDYALDIERRLSSVNDEWEDNRRDDFVSAAGSAAGSGLSQVINSVSKHFEDTRRDRLGTPFGVTLGFPSPQALEAPYARNSELLLRRNVEASRLAIGGQTSLRAYVAGLGGDEASALITEIGQLYSSVLRAIEDIDNPLYSAVESDRDAVQVAYNAISRQVVNLKTDLPSVTCVSITYVDNPSDSD